MDEKDNPIELSDMLAINRGLKSKNEINKPVDETPMINGFKMIKATTIKTPLL